MDTPWPDARGRHQFAGCGRVFGRGGGGGFLSSDWTPRANSMIIEEGKREIRKCQRDGWIHRGGLVVRSRSIDRKNIAGISRPPSGTHQLTNIRVHNLLAKFREFCVYKVIASHPCKPKMRNMSPKFSKLAKAVRSLHIT